MNDPTFSHFHIGSNCQPKEDNIAEMDDQMLELEVDHQGKLATLSNYVCQTSKQRLSNHYNFVLTTTNYFCVLFATWVATNFVSKCRMVKSQGKVTWTSLLPRQMSFGMCLCL